MSNRFKITDTFLIKGKKIGVIQVPVEKVDNFPINVGDSLVNDDGEGYNVLEVEWFYTSCLPSPYRSVAVVFDRMPYKRESVRLFKESTGNWWGDNEDG